MNKISVLKTKLDLSTRQFLVFAVVSILFLGGCLTLLIPATQNLVIWFGEFLIRRPLNHPVWRGRFVSKSLMGIVLYAIFFFTFFYNNIFSKENIGKKLFVIIFSACFIFIILFQANWTFSDDHEYVTTTAINKYVPLYSGNGRFYPLRYIHYNIPLFFYRLLGVNSGLPIEAHYTVIALFYAITVLCLYLLFNSIEPVKNGKYPPFTVFFSGIFLLFNEAFCSVFMSLIYPETVVIMLFAVFMYMYYQALKTGKIRYYIGAILAAVYATYCKEPVFGAFLIIAFTNYIFRLKKITKKEHIFYASLIANGIVYITLYYVISFRNATGFYNEGRIFIQGLSFILSVFMNNPVLLLIFIFGLIRLFYLIIKKEQVCTYYDSLLFAGIGYICAYILLHLNSGYYFLPAVLLFLPSLVYWAKYLYQRKKQYALCLFACLMMLCFGNNWIVDTAVSVWHERREFIPYIDELLAEYDTGKEFIWYESNNTIADNMFYTAVRDWRKYTATAFLNYRNASLEKEFFTVKNEPDTIDMNSDMLLFYPTDNDQGQAMPESLIEWLKDNQFELYKDSYSILIYKKL